MYKFFMIQYSKKTIYNVNIAGILHIQCVTHIIFFYLRMCDRIVHKWMNLMTK